MNAVREVVGPTKATTHEEATEIFTTTGIDITGLNDVTKDCRKRCPELNIANFIVYAKDLKEYMALTLMDRITVLKGK